MNSNEITAKFMLKIAIHIFYQANCQTFRPNYGYFGDGYIYCVDP